jgi:hypothetical protein
MVHIEDLEGFGFLGIYLVFSLGVLGIYWDP